MAITTADLQRLWSADTVGQLRKPLVWNSITTQRRTEPWSSGQVNQVEIPRPNWGANDTPTPSEGISPQEVSRDAAWTATRAIDSDIVSFTTSGRYDVSNAVGYEDSLELPFDAVDQTRNEQVQRGADYLDGVMVTAVEGFSSTTVVTAGTAGSVFIAPNGTPTGTNANQLPKLAVDNIVSAAFQDNWFSPRVDGDPGPRWITMSPVLFDLMQTDLLDRGYSLDSLTQGILSDNSVGAGGPMVMQYRGFLIYATPAANAASATPADRWTITAGLRGAVAAAVRSPLVQLFSPEENQTTDPGWLIRMRVAYAYAELRDSMLKTARIEQD